MKLEVFLKKEVALSGKQIRQAKFRENGICVNQKRTRVTQQVLPGDIVEILLEADEQESKHLLSFEKNPVILYEDEDLLIADKPAGIVVHPSPGHYGDSLSNMLMYYFRSKGEHVRIRAIGRLDKDTSGVLVFAKNQVAAARLSEQKENGTLKKEYLAIVQGELKETQGVIRQKIGKMQDSLMKMQVSNSGNTAITHYRVLKTEKEWSKLLLHLETGRTHQIRVHMAWMGYPLVGDPLYGKEDAWMKRTALHAWRIELRQPFTGETIVAEAPIPEDMKNYLTIEKKTEKCHNSDTESI